MKYSPKSVAPLRGAQGKLPDGKHRDASRRGIDALSSAVAIDVAAALTSIDSGTRARIDVTRPYWVLHRSRPRSYGMKAFGVVRSSSQ